MRFRIDRNDERPLYVQIVDEVRSSIMLGLLKPGDRLPSVRKLAKQLDINLHTVRHAYSILSEHLIVSSRSGAGTIVRGQRGSAAVATGADPSDRIRAVDPVTLRRKRGGQRD